jgi:hypothetical protein
MTAATLERANEALRTAVEERLAGKPACCEGTKMRGDSLLNDRGENYAEWEPALAEQTPAVKTLHHAIAAVRDRHGKYGPPTQHFARTSALVNAAFGTTFTAADWALVMVLDKIARQLGPQATNDAAIDIAGYAACHQECRRT